MKRHDIESEAELQRSLEEQEQALTALLERVMQSPLGSLAERLDALRRRLDAVEESNAKNVQTVEVVLTETVETEAKRIRRNLEDAANNLKEGLTGLSESLHRHDSVQAERHDHITTSLAQGHEQLATIGSKADAAAGMLAAAERGVEQLGGVLVKLHEQEQTSSSQLNKDVNELAQRQASQLVQLEERLAAIEPGLAQRIDTMSATIGASTREIIQAYATLYENQKDVISAVVQQELRLKLQPLEKRAAWLTALFGCTSITLLILVAAQLLR